MTLTGQPRPRVSRETRLLLATVLLSLAALWVLARIRYPEPPTTSNPMPPVLTQLAPRPVFEDLASAVFQLEPELLPALVALGAEPAAPVEADRSTPDVITALRFRDDAAVALLGAAPDGPLVGATLVARDRATGVGVLRVAPSPAPRLRMWTPQRMQFPRYMIVTDVSPAGVSLRPVFVGALRASPSLTWSASIWTVPSQAGVPAGAFVFTTNGALAGLVVDQTDGSAIVPADTVIAAAERLLTEEQKQSGTLGVGVQALTREISAASGVTSGVVVTWVDPQGPAATLLAPTDIIEAIDDEAIATPGHWRARMLRLAAGETIVARIRRGGEAAEVQLTARPPPAPADAPRLGLTMRTRSRAGAEVTRVEDGSVAARAGIRVGDVISRIGEIAAPTTAQVNRAFAAQSTGQGVLAAITRGEEHIVVALVKP